MGEDDDGDEKEMGVEDEYGSDETESNLKIAKKRRVRTRSWRWAIMVLN